MRIFVDAPVVGGCEDDKFAEASTRHVRMRKGVKRFDSVAMMRSIRDKISLEIEGMTLEEELRWLQTQELEDPFLRRLRDRAVQEGEKPRRE